MNFICADYNGNRNVNPVDINGDAEEADECIWRMTLFDIADKTLSLCSQNGICAFDTSVNFVRCLCNEGYIGNYCENTGMFMFMLFVDR